MNTAANRGTPAPTRELDDTDAICPGYGELTAVETPKNQNAEVALMFVREDRLTGDYTADSIGIPRSCSGIGAAQYYPSSSCSGHRILLGRVTVDPSDTSFR
ncbi:hypothetical protein [Actinoplanes xinjiangensis]|uniref:Uncharacterized protein n=1 Tax=Actinoplanes xinjiangensis TaxID=512350 RepID=A0A316FLI7_9ACTN|nr:hypothetical protein [Actinoplanes xinjiangensis]PWK49025.1 hypothetical protein BC793_105376 [Actinoplanes xinjiangensis]GIF38732.1 hypothetical protein Axi01nite_30430 [Actinoplanes xinjiangensis]